MKKHVAIIIRGRVQGVGFRYCASREAEEQGITGFVRNQGDGSVYIEAEGSSEAIESFLAWCRKGPLTSHVDSVAISEGPLVPFEKFEVQRGVFP